LRRALYLKDWGPETTFDEWSTAAQNGREYLAEQFVNRVRATLKQGTGAARLAVMSMLAEMGPSSQTTDDTGRPGRDSSTYQIAPRFGPDLAELVRSGDIPGIRETAAQTLGQVFADPQVAVPALSGLLDSRSVAERRMAVKGLAGLMHVAAQLTSGT